MLDSHFYLIPLTALLADLSILAFYFSRKGVFERIFKTQVFCLAAMNLCLLALLTAENREQALVYLHILRHFLFFFPVVLLLLSAYLSNRKLLHPGVIGAFAYLLFLLITIQFTFFSGSKFLIREIRLYPWGYFPFLNTGGRFLLGGLFLYCSFFSMYFLLWRRDTPAREEFPGLALLILLWWVGMFSNIGALLGFNFYPLGNALDAALCIFAAVRLHRAREEEETPLFLYISEIFASLSFGLVAGLVAFFLTPINSGAAQTVLALTVALASIVFLQFLKRPASQKMTARKNSRAGATLFSPELDLTDLNLSRQETRICELIARTYTRKQIAFFLGIADGTLRNHLMNIYAKTLDKDRSTSPSPSDSRDKFQRLTVFLRQFEVSDQIAEKP